MLGTDQSKANRHGDAVGRVGVSVQISGYSLDRLRDDGEFVLYWAHPKPAEPLPILLLTPALTRLSPETVEKIDHECSLRSELDSACAVPQSALSARDAQLTPVLADPAGQTLDGFLSRATRVTEFLGFAVGLATALGRLHERKLIHKDARKAAKHSAHRRKVGFL